MGKIADEQLVRDVQDGDIDAFEELVRRYQARVRSFVMRFVRDRASADDVVQETFLGIYKTIDRVKTNRKFSVYLFSVARNQAISAIRKRKNHAPLSVASNVSDGTDLERELEKGEESRRVQDALLKIDEKYRTVITLYYFEDVSYQGIAKNMHVPVNTVRTYLRRAKEHLKKELQ